MPENNLAERVADIEKTIGDLDQVFEALKNCLEQSPFQPTCPPYCGHADESEFVDERSMAAQVAELNRYLGDLAVFHECLRSVLAARPQPTCPPYCAHEAGNVEQSGS